MSCFDNIVLDFLKKIFTIEDSHFYIDNPKTYQRVINDIKSGIADYPILLLSDEPYYSLNEDWGNSDFRNEICVNNDYLHLKLRNTQIQMTSHKTIVISHLPVNIMFIIHTTLI